MKLKICLLGLLCLFLQAYSQPRNTNKTLKPGDQVPDILISGILNYKAGEKNIHELRLSDFKDKLLILDFWGTFCTPCLHLLPKYDSLQNEFAGKVQFLLISQEKAEKVASFFKRNSYNLPSVTDDILLSALFPHNSIPHEIWIKNGILIASTYGEDVSREAISRALNGNFASIEQKTDDLTFDPNQPLLANGNGKGQVLYQSIITPYNFALNSVAGFHRTPSEISSIALNHSALALYHQAFAHTDPLLDLGNRTTIELPDSVKQKVVEAEGVAYHEWIKKYGFCYGLVLPPDFKGDITQVMVSDLNRFFGTRFGIEGHLEKKAVDCLVLSRIPGAPSIESKGGKPLFSMPAKGLVLENLPIASLCMPLAQLYSTLSTPFLDETGYATPVDLKLNCDLSDMPALKKDLLRSGLLLVIKKRTIPLIVIRQTSPGLF